MGATAATFTSECGGGGGYDFSLEGRYLLELPNIWDGLVCVGRRFF